MKRRLLLVPAFMGGFGETDGIVTTYGNLLPYFASYDRPVDILYYGHKDEIKEVGSVRLISHRPRWPVKIDPIRWLDFSLLFFNDSQLRPPEEYALVQSSTPDPMGICAKRVARQARCPFITVYHTAINDYVEIRTAKKVGKLLGKAAGGFIKNWHEWYHRHGDLVLVPSRYTQKKVQGFSSSPVHIFSRGIDTEKYSPAKRTRNENKIRAIYAGRVAHEKNLSLLVKIFREYKKAELMIVGDGPYLKIMKKALPNAIFTGQIVGEEICRAYANADFFVFPSKTDTLGNVVLEAQASGLPAIVTDQMGPQELVEDGKNGFVTGTDDEFYQAIDKLATNHELRKRMSLYAREKSKERTWQSIFNKLIEEYDYLLDNYSSNKKTERIGN